MNPSNEIDGAVQRALKGLADVAGEPLNPNKELRGPTLRKPSPKKASRVRAKHARKRNR